MPQATGRHDTPHASRYLQQLCKHFAHKVPAACDEREGRITFPMAEARLLAEGPALVVTLDAPAPEGLARGREVIDSHLKRFAFREGFEAMAWDEAGAAAPG